MAILALLPNLIWTVAAAAESRASLLPNGVKVAWDVEKAHREATATRERVSLNGLWRWQTANTHVEHVPPTNWGYFKVPGSWPGITDYMQKDSQTVWAHPTWSTQRFGSVSAAWYEREFAVPASWNGRRISLEIEYLNSFATVFIDGKRAGELRFPGGEIDLTPACAAGRTHQLSLLVVAMPLKGVMISYTDSASAREVKGAVARRGLCGDVYLLGAPAGPRISDVRVETSVRKEQITLDVAIDGLAGQAGYLLRSRIKSKGRTIKEFTSRPFDATKAGRVTLAEKWMPNELWDIHTPQHMHEVEVSLHGSTGKELDAWPPVRFGFRELWIDGRDFILNGKRLALSALPLDNAQVSAALASYAAARESMQRLQSFGINFVYTHNYDCKPGAHLGFSEILKAADDTGMLVSFSQPHFSDYEWGSTDADKTNGYMRHAQFYVRAAQNHPSVVAYSMSHNATGYAEDMNPDLIGETQDSRDSWSARNSKLAMRAEAIVSQLDPSRIVYHHAGNVGALHAINFYPNFVPIQEMSDWFEGWSTNGRRPVFTCEYGAPFSWDWTMYRGWYKGEREFGSAKVPWEFCLAEWNAQFVGDAAFQVSEAEKTNLRWESKQFAANKLWHRWDYPHQVGSTIFEERYPVFARYFTENWRAFRTFGVSAISPWEHGIFWKLRPGVDKRRQPLTVDWESLQRPGFSADYIEQRYERMDLAFERGDWLPTEAADALMRNNRPLLAYIGGKPAAITGNDHNFNTGDSVEKQLVILNNSREEIRCNAEWLLALRSPIGGRREVIVPPGGQQRVGVRFELPANVAPGRYELNAKFTFSNGETQRDRFAIDILEPATTPALSKRIALFDPREETAALLKKLGIRAQAIDATSDLSPYDLLVVGKAALTTSNNAPDLTRVRAGLKVIVFEQTSETLEKRLGFRVQEYGLRNVFPRVPDHPIIGGLAAEHLRDWHGEATLLSSRLKYQLRPRHGPTVEWCGIEVPRLWRCGNRGNVASVLIEKPAKGDFFPIVDGGYSLQYTPLLEYREGDGLVVFCQLDVTGRTENDPAAERLVAQLLRYVSTWKAAPHRKTVYAGEPAGHRHLAASGIDAAPYEGQALSHDTLLILGPDTGSSIKRGEFHQFIRAGGKAVAFGFGSDSTALLPFAVRTRKAEHISAWFAAPTIDSPFAGIGPADVHNRDPRELSLVAEGMKSIANGVLATSADESVVVCQLVPWRFDGKQMNLKRTHRRVAFLASRLMANAGARAATPLLERYHQPPGDPKREQRWVTGYYFDVPEEWDDPYRFFRW